jgi:hypothetical protein
VSGSVDLGGGTDTLKLGAFTNNGTTDNVEKITGVGGNDTITVSSGANVTIIGGGGYNELHGHASGDMFVFDQASNGNFSKVMNIVAGEKIGLDVAGTSTLSQDTYVLSGALVDGTNITHVADDVARLATSLSTSGKGGFVYEDDTGELYYSATGNFSAGGTLIGVITTDGSTPWTYNFSQFQAV